MLTDKDLDIADTIDLADAATFAAHDLTGFWRTLRDTRPLHRNHARNGRPGFWVLSRHEDIVAVFRDNVTFTSERGNVLVKLLAGGDSAAGKMLAVTDGPRHTELRKILMRALSPRAIRDVAAFVRRTTRGLVRDAVARGECDFAHDIANHIPMLTICSLLGVPDSDREFLLAQTKTALSTDGGRDDADADADPDAADAAAEVESEMARNEILLYFQDLVEQLRAAPGDDLVSTLVNSTLDGVPLSDDDVVLNCYSLILGGDETSRLTMIDSGFTLATHPEEWRRLKNGDVAIDTAVEEVLRWASPGMHFGRTAMRDTAIHGERIAEGEIVTMWNASGNRDERVFDRPDVFDLGRTPNRHLTFGHGPHFCVGAYLAKVEISELLLALRDFTTGLERTGPAPRIRSNLLTGFTSVPVRLHPDRAGLARPDRPKGER